MSCRAFSRKLIRVTLSTESLEGAFCNTSRYEANENGNQGQTETCALVAYLFTLRQPVRQSFAFDEKIVREIYADPRELFDNFKLCYVRLCHVGATDDLMNLTFALTLVRIEMFLKKAQQIHTPAGRQLRRFRSLISFVQSKYGLGDSRIGMVHSAGGCSRYLVVP